MILNFTGFSYFFFLREHEVLAERREIREKGYILIITLNFVFQCLCSQHSVVKLSQYFHNIIFFCLFLGLFNKLLGEHVVLLHFLFFVLQKRST